jgi:hypothetical protein
MNLISNTFLFLLSASFAAAGTRTNVEMTKSLFDLGCATLCADHAGDPVDVSGVDFADLISLYLESNSTNTTGGNSTDNDNDAYLIYGDMECWDVGEVTDMSAAFAYQDEFNIGIECWDVKSVTDMSEMFLEASSFDQNLNSWAEKVPRADIVTTDMFKGSGCEIQTDPDTIGRPWCQFDSPLFSPQFECFFFKKCDGIEGGVLDKLSGLNLPGI